MYSSPLYRNVLPWMVLISALLPDAAQAQALEGSMEAFHPASSDIMLSRPARPDTYFDQTGRKFALLATESGRLEAWAYPLKLIQDFRLSFFPGSATQPIEAHEIVHRIDVRPEATTLTYVYQSFTVRAHFVASIHEAGAVIFLDVDSTEPLSIVAGFIPAMEPMWPAGLGGQFARWDGEQKAYLISESSGRNHGYIGSPAAAGVSYTPAHMLSEHPNEFRIDITDPLSTHDRLIPIVIAGGKGERAGVRELYRSLAQDPARVYDEALNHFQRLRSSTPSVRTPVSEIDLALEWAKISYDNLLVDNPDISGTGLMAGLAQAGRGGRPGFGWFFGGDTYINALSLHSLGMFDEARGAIDFMGQFQRADGKMPHEVTQAVGYVDWFEDYPYAYIHADTSPYSIVSLHDHYAATGDLEFVKAAWPGVVRAFQWARATDTDGDGLMDNEAAGLGALEFGALTGIQTDIYLGAVWIRSLRAMWQLAIAVNDRETADAASVLYDKAVPAFEQFWDGDIGQYAYAFNADGETVAEVSPWSAVGLMFGLGTEDRAAQSLRRMAYSDLTTDWGVRMLSTQSDYFEPLNYNYGAVWPFLTSWVTTAQYARGLPLQAYSNLMGSVGHVFRGSLGDVNEVFSGARHTWPQESVPHQGFCSAATVLPLMRGLFGMTFDAASSTFSLAPAVPADWDFWEMDGFRAADESVTIIASLTPERESYHITRSGSEPFRLAFSPRYAPGTQILSIEVDGRSVPVETRSTSEWVQPRAEFPIDDDALVTVALRRSLEIVPPVWTTDVGDENAGLRIIQFSRMGDEAVLRVQGRAGQLYGLDVRGFENVVTMEGAVWQDNHLRIQLPSADSQPFVEAEVRFALRPL